MIPTPAATSPVGPRSSGAGSGGTLALEPGGVDVDVREPGDDADDLEVAEPVQPGGFEVAHHLAGHADRVESHAGRDLLDEGVVTGHRSWPAVT